MKRLRSEDSRFRIGKSTVRGAGRGLFATRTMAKGEMLDVPGFLVRRNSFSDQCTGYADAYKFRVGTHLLIPSGCASLVNHSSTPNMEKIIERDSVTLRSLRAILRGEELFFRYSRYAQQRFFRKGAFENF
jgi:hypothetical protein